MQNSKWRLIDWKNNILNQIMLCHGKLNENYDIFDSVHKILHIQLSIAVILTHWKP